MDQRKERSVFTLHMLAFSVSQVGCKECAREAFGTKRGEDPFGRSRQLFPM